MTTSDDAPDHFKPNNSCCTDNHFDQDEDVNQDLSSVETNEIECVEEFDKDYYVVDDNTVDTVDETIAPTFTHSYLVRLKLLSDQSNPNPNCCCHAVKLIDMIYKNFAANVSITDLRTDTVEPSTTLIQADLDERFGYAESNHNLKKKFMFLRLFANVNFHTVKTTLLGYLNSNNIYFNVHLFSPMNYDYSTVGWLKDLHPTIHNSTRIVDTLQAQFESKWNALPSDEKQEWRMRYHTPDFTVPKLALIKDSPRARHKNKNKEVVADMLSIVTPTEDTLLVRNFITTMYHRKAFDSLDGHMGEFIPSDYGQVHGWDKFKQLLQTHKASCDKLDKIPLGGLTIELLHAEKDGNSLAKSLDTIPGALALEQTNDSQTYGRYFVIVDCKNDRRLSTSYTLPWKSGTRPFESYSPTPLFLNTQKLGFFYLLPC